MRKIVGIILCLFFQNFTGAQVVITGYVFDEADNSKLIDANVQVCGRPFGTVTDHFGYYKIVVDSLPVCLQFSYIGFAPVTKEITSMPAGNINVSLSGIELAPVNIVSPGRSPETYINVTQIPVEKLKLIPSLSGEPDLMKSLTIAPGISSATEGSSVLVIRGGNPDQNLFLLDGINIFNPNHLFGFFSAFNPSAIDDIKVYKGDFPGEYGGRLSSVIDITTREGPKKGYSANSFTIGTVSSNLYSEGPLTDNKSAYSIGARVSYLGLLLLPQIISVNSSGQGNYNNYWLYDINADIQTQAGEKGNLKISFFHNRDFFTSADLSNQTTSTLKYVWGNTAAGINYQLPYSTAAKLNIKLTYSNYLFSAALNQEVADDVVLSDTYQDRSGINNLSAVFSIYRQTTARHHLEFGANLETALISPNHTSGANYIDGTALSTIDTFEFKYTSVIPWLFFDDVFFITPKWKLHTALRAGYYVQDKYTASLVEPRISLSYLPGDFTALNVAFTGMTQPYHLLSLNSSSLPNEIWLPAYSEAPVESAYQYSFGFFQNIRRLHAKFTAEVYYKVMRNLVSFTPGELSLFNLSQEWTDRVEANGLGIAYGTEFFCEGSYKQFHYTIEYTFARSFRRFPDINEGQLFPGKYDIIHDAGCTIGFEITSRWSLQSQFVFQSGRPITLPSSVVVSPAGYPTYLYDEINGSRMPPYHRLDIAFIRDNKKAGNRSSQWTLGAYNVYARSNPFYLELIYHPLPTGAYPPLGYSSFVSQHTVFKFVPIISYHYAF